MNALYAVMHSKYEVFSPEVCHLECTMVLENEVNVMEKMEFVKSITNKILSFSRSYRNSTFSHKLQLKIEVFLCLLTLKSSQFDGW